MARLEGLFAQLSLDIEGDTYVIGYTCLYTDKLRRTPTGGLYKMERISADLSDTELGAYLLKGLAETSRMSGEIPGGLAAEFEKIEKDFPERFKRTYDWEAYDRIGIYYRGGYQPHDFSVDGRASGGNEPRKSLLPINSTAAECGAHIRKLMAQLKREHTGEGDAPLPRRKRKTAAVAKVAAKPAAKARKKPAAKTRVNAKPAARKTVRRR